MKQSLLRAFLLSCSFFSAFAHADTFPRSVEVTGDCVHNYFVKNVKVKLIDKGRAVVSGIADRGIQIDLLDNNVLPLGTSGKAFRNEDGSFEIVTSLRSNSDLESFNLSFSDTPLMSGKLCELNFNSNKGSLKRELLPTQQVQSDNEAIVNLASEITKGASSDKEKLTLIQEWMVANIEYDYIGVGVMIDGETGWETPSAVRTLERKKGICSELSMLSGALLRAVNIPNRLIGGKFLGGAHQWNEAYIDGAWFEYEAQLPADSILDWNDYERIGILWRL